ncbi:MAG: hypothetical protein V3V74_02210 [Nitrosomonadaceae bacterium]
MTPEGKVKAKVKRILNRAEAYYFMPVQTGYGMPTLDFLCFHMGSGFAIEAKAPGKKPTKRQEAIIHEIEYSGSQVFVIDGTEGSYDSLITFLECKK